MSALSTGGGGSFGRSISIPKCYFSTLKQITSTMRCWCPSFPTFTEYPRGNIVSGKCHWWGERGTNQRHEQCYKHCVYSTLSNRVCLLDVFQPRSPVTMFMNIQNTICTFRRHLPETTKRTFLAPSASKFHAKEVITGWTSLFVLSVGGPSCKFIKGASGM